MGTIGRKDAERDAGGRAGRKMRGDSSHTRCTIETTVGLIGGRWKAVVIFHLLAGTRRFGELRRLLPNATARMLTLQLRELEADGLVHRKVFAEVPPRVEYTLTDEGASLGPIVTAMGAWGKAYERRARHGTR
jgi:DNA-binding HxlR family transcriptional regulator